MVRDEYNELESSRRNYKRPMSKQVVLRSLFERSGISGYSSNSNDNTGLIIQEDSKFESN